MKSQIIQQGAEAIIYKVNNKIVKNRTKKSYRIPELDKKIRKSRTKSEAKIIEKLKKIINVPKLIITDLVNHNIHMQYIQGQKLSEHLEKLNWKEISKQIGEILTKLHNQEIIHGDLTTSNMIYVENNNSNNINSQISQATHNKAKKSLNIINDNIKSNNSKLFLIDFGLGFHSKKIEDKAVDLHLLKQALNAKHYKIADKCFKIIIKNYKPNQYKLIIERIPIIESRGRYKKKH